MKTQIFNHLFIIILLVIGLFTSCRNNDGTEISAVTETEDFDGETLGRSFEEPSAFAENKTSTSDVVIQDLQVTGKKIIKDGSMGIEVENLKDSRAWIDSLLKGYDAYYSSENFVNNDYASSMNLVIRIQSSSFEKFIADIEKGKGRILYKNINSRDVTEQFIDLETRLENKRNFLKRYNELLDQAKTVKDILEIQEKVRVIEEEIESTEGRLRYLKNQVSYSTLNLTISKKIDITERPGKREGFFTRLMKSLVSGWFGLIDVLIFLVRLWPLWLIVIAVFPILIKIRNRKRSNSKNDKDL